MNFIEHYLNEMIVVDTPNFKRWFNGSKIVNKDGTPMVVYHGTRNKFDAFDYTHLGIQGRSEGVGFYFTDKEDLAKGYGEVLKAFLKIKKPLDTNDPNFSRLVIKKIIRRIVELEKQKEGTEPQDGFLSNYGDISYEGFNSVVDSALDLLADDESATDLQGGLVGSGVSPRIVNDAIYDVTGYDGIIAHGFGGEGKQDMRIYIPFFPNQIKSIDNKIFNPNSDKIHEEIHEEIDMLFKEYYNEIEYVYGEEIDYGDADEAYRIAKKHGISVLSDKEIYVIAKANDEVVGALWTAWNSEEYSFDIVVREDFQGEGLGTKLVDIAISTYEQDKEAYGDEAILRADVINPKMEKMLLKKGFEIESRQPGHALMTRK